MNRRELVKSGVLLSSGISLPTITEGSPVPNEYVNVIDFGAKGDGINDDTQAFKNAALELRMRGGGTFYIPPTKVAYLLDEDIQIWNNVNVVFDGFVRRKSNKKRTFDSVFIPVSGAQHVTFTNVKIDCNNIAGMNGVNIRRNNRFCRISGAYIKNCRHDVLGVGGGRAIVLEDGVTDNLPKQVIVSDVFVENCYMAIGYNGGGLEIGKTNNALTIIDNITAFNCDVLLGLFGNNPGYPHTGNMFSVIANNIMGRNVGKVSSQNNDGKGIIHSTRASNVLVNNCYIFNDEDYSHNVNFFQGDYNNIHLKNTVIDANIHNLVAGGKDMRFPNKGSYFDIVCNGRIDNYALASYHSNSNNNHYKISVDSVTNDRFVSPLFDETHTNYLEFSSAKYNFCIEGGIGKQGINSKFNISDFIGTSNKKIVMGRDIVLCDVNGQPHTISVNTSGDLLLNGIIIN